MEKVSLKSKLNEIRLELSREMNKSGKNDYSHYTYFQLKDFMPRALELFNEKGVFVEFWVSKDRLDYPNETTVVEQFGENGELISKTTKTNAKSEFIEVAHILATNLDDEEDVVELTKETGDVRLSGAQPVQNVGGKSTYMKRYMYMDLLEINENDAVEEQTGKPVKTETVKTTQSKPKVTKVETQPKVEQPKVEQPKVEIETQPELVSSQIDTEELLTMDTKVAIANEIKAKGLEPKDIILGFAKSIGTEVPLLKEKDADAIRAYVENIASAV